MKIKDLIAAVSTHLGKSATILVVNMARHDHEFKEDILKLPGVDTPEGIKRSSVQLREIRNNALRNNTTDVVLLDHPIRFEFNRLTNEVDAAIVISSFEHIDVAVVTKLRSVEPMDVRVFELEYKRRKVAW